MAIIKRMHSVLSGTRAEIFAETGHYKSQEAFASDYGLGAGLRYVWNGAAWVLPSDAQLIGRQFTSVSASGTTETLLLTVNLPPLGINDGFLCHTRWDLTGSTNNKTTTIKLAGTTLYNQPFSNVNHVGLVHDFFTENRGATNSQISGHANANVYGTGPAVMAVSTVQTNVATALTIHGTKASAGEVLTLQSAQVWVFGGTAQP